VGAGRCHGTEHSDVRRLNGRPRTTSPLRSTDIRHARTAETDGITRPTSRGDRAKGWGPSCAEEGPHWSSEANQSDVSLDEPGHAAHVAGVRREDRDRPDQALGDLGDRRVHD